MNYVSKSTVLFAVALAITGMAAAQVGIGSASAEPTMVEPGETIDDQGFTVEVRGLSTDGEVDYVTLQFPEQFSEDDIEMNSVDSNVSIEEDAELVEGEDNRQAAVVGLNPEDDNEANAEVTFDVSVAYPEDFESMEADIEVEDSDGSTASETVSVNAEAEETENETMQNETEPGMNDTTNETMNDTGDETMNDTVNDTEDPGVGLDNETDQPGNETETNGGIGGLIESFMEWLRNIF